MKKIVALTGVILLGIMYVLTIITAIIDSTASMGYFKASIAATILIPIFLYIYMAYYRYKHKDEIALENILKEEAKKKDKEDSENKEK